MPDELRCSTCRFWEPPSGGRVISGECHRHAPAARVCRGDTIDDGYYAYWPLVMSDDWCGDWHPPPVKQRIED